MAQVPLGWRFVMFFLLIGTPSYAADSTAHDISRFIDERLQLKGREDALSFADDATFLRRLTLDLIGRIPTVAEVREFLEDESDSKRFRAIERLLYSGAHFKNMATFWRRAWVPQADTPEFASVADGFEHWLSHELRQKTTYDRLVAKVLCWNSDAGGADPVDPRGFYLANEGNPPNLAASATRAFLGINLDCAQCHNHPFARWTRAQFWQTAAFFAAPGRNDDGKAVPPRIKIPGSETEYEPALLSRERIEWPDTLDSVAPRRILSDWMMTESDSYIAKNAVNRLWAHFFGEAIVEPMDDLSAAAAAVGEHRAELLEELAQAFVKSKYDAELFIQAIVQSDAYRLASLPPPADQSDDAEWIARSTAVIRGLTGEQLYDSLRTAAGLPPERSETGGRGRGDQRREFVSVFYVEQAHNAERSISQALALMNGSLVGELSETSNNPMLAALVAAPFMNLDEQVDAVFIAVLGRRPSTPELQTVMHHFEVRPEATRGEVLGDLFWVLVNSPEFNTNH
ncbi:MAG TPA: DUF1549 domain-containing protein [Pirellulales bacterium]|nr:DUF1549 domain-containing protein [Pirellulales bacterium]